MPFRVSKSIMVLSSLATMPPCQTECPEGAMILMTPFTLLPFVNTCEIKKCQEPFGTRRQRYTLEFCLRQKLHHPHPRQHLRRVLIHVQDQCPVGSSHRKRQRSSPVRPGSLQEAWKVNSVAALVADFLAQALQGMHSPNLTRDDAISLMLTRANALWLKLRRN